MKSSLILLLMWELFSSMITQPALVWGSDPSGIDIVKTSPEYGSEIGDLGDLLITIEFNQKMDPTLVEDFVLDQRGITDENGDPIEISGQFTWLDPRTLQFKPNIPLKPNATYQVSLFSVRNEEGEEMEGVPYRLAFMTVKQ